MSVLARTCRQFHNLGDAYLTIVGAMTLQGPHHVAKQSSTISDPFSPSAASNSALLTKLCTPCLPIVEEKLLKLL